MLIASPHAGSSDRSHNSGRTRRWLTASAIAGLGLGAAPIGAAAGPGGSSSTSVASSKPSMVSGESVIFTATVTGTPAGFNPSGTVSFQADASDIGGCTAAPVAGATNPTTATCITTALTAAGAPHAITASYNGDSQYAASSPSPAISQIVNKSATKGVGSVDHNPSVSGQTVIFTATESAASPGSGVPTGNVRFQADGSDICGGASPLDVGGVASCSVSSLSVGGVHQVRGLYAGDANFLANNSALTTQQVGKDATTTALTSSVAGPVWGQSTTLTATVTATSPGSGTPGGTARFQDSPSGVPVDIASCTLVTLVSGAAGCSISSLSVSTHHLTAQYSGDSSFTASTGTASLTVGPGGTTTTVTGDPATVNPGDTVVFTSTTSPANPAAGTPAGTVDFQDAKGTEIGCPSQPVGADGTATCATGALTSGPHSITAIYSSGDGNFSSSSSDGFAEYVRFPSNTTVTSSDLSSIVGQSVTFTATVTSGAPPPPTGAINFMSDGISIAGCAAQGLDGGGQAACSTAALGAGTHAITATYTSDDANQNMAGTSPPISQVVNAGNTVTTLGADVNPAVTGQTVTLSSNVSAVNPAMGIPDGTVSFTTTGGAEIPNCGSQPLDPAGNASCVTTFNAGDFPLGATYLGGGGNFETSASPTVSEHVDKDGTTTALASSSGESATVSGQSVTYTATVTANAPGSGAPGGAVEFQEAGNNFCLPFCEPCPPFCGGPGPCPPFCGGPGFCPPFCGPAPPTTISGCDAVPLVDGVARCTDAPVATAGHTITAIYLGDANYLTSNGGPLTQAVNRDTTTTGLASSSAVNTSVSGESVTYTATVSSDAPGSGVPTTSVQFLDGGVIIAGCDARPLSGVAPLAGLLLRRGFALSQGSATATCVVTYATADGGTHHSITAVYAGDPNFITSTGGPLTQTVNQAATTTTGESSSLSIKAGESVTLTATVAVTAPGAGTPTGTVDFQAGGVDIPACSAQTVGAGTATCTTTSLTTGTPLITMFYRGDPDFAASTSSGFTITVGKDPTGSALSSSGPTVHGQSVTFTDTISPSDPGSGTPTGSVEFQAGGVDIPGCAAQPLNSNLTGPAARIAGRAAPAVMVTAPAATCDTTGLPTGTASITAIYGGDLNFDPSTSNPVDQVVSQASTSTVVTSSGTPSVAGQAVSYTALVSAVGPGAGTPTGTVRFQLNGADVPTCIAQTLLAGSVACTMVHPAVGTYQITGIYSGDGDFAASTSEFATQVVSRDSSKTTLTSGPSNPSFAGEAVTYTATISANAPGSGTPTGTVDFQEGNVDIGTCSAPGPVLSAGGVATCVVTYASPGSHSITAIYSGDANFLGSSTSTALLQIVGRDQTTTVVTSGPSNPSFAGEGVTYTATVAPDASGAGTPGGPVSFSDSVSGPIPGCGGIDLSTGTAQCVVTTYATVGTHTITAVYGGSQSFLGSTSTAYVQTVSPASTDVVVSSDTQPSVFGQSVTFTAAVAASKPGRGIPTGPVAFRDSITGVIPGCGAQPLDGGGTATCTTTALVVGARSITAVYGGDLNFAAGTSEAITQDVGRDASTTGLNSSTSDTSVSGETVTWTATVTAAAPGGGTPTGTVTFTDGGGSIAGCATPETLDNAGKATCSVTYPGVGSHPVRAVYSGDGNFVESISSSFTLDVGRDTTATGLNSSTSETSVSGETVTWTATVTADTPGGGTPTGAVTFKDGGATIAACATPVTLDGTGKATCAVTYAGVSSHPVTAVYGGDGNFVDSTSSPFTLTVGKDATATVLTSSGSPSPSAGAVTFTATVTADSPGSGIPTGKVGFTSGGSDISGCTAQTLVGGGATCTTTSLVVAGAHTISAVYAADANYAGSTSNALAQTVEGANATWVRQAYLDILLRTVDPGGLAYYSGNLDRGTMTRPGVALLLTAVGEYRVIEVQNLYSQFLHRGADGGGSASYAAQLKAGASDQSVASEIAGSSEYFQTRGGGSDSGFLTALYHDALGRDPDGGGLSSWLGAMAGGMSTRQVAMAFITGAEGADHQVSLWYQQFLRRAGDAGGISSYAGALLHGSSYEQVIAALVGSAEYLARLTT